VLTALEEVEQVNGMIRALVLMREQLARDLNSLSFILTVYPSDANFLLVKTSDPHSVYDYLLRAGIVVRDRSKVELCDGCLRITVGTEKENAELVVALRRFAAEAKK
jgi:histidinol-phosphate aminotransferase